MHLYWILIYGESFTQRSCTRKGGQQPRSQSHTAALCITWARAPGQLDRDTFDLRSHIAYKWISAFSGVWGLASTFLSVTKPTNSSKALLLVPLQEHCVEGSVGQGCFSLCYTIFLLHSIHQSNFQQHKALLSTHMVFTTVVLWFKNKSFQSGC